jgi:uncharacterized protein YdeI (YjbR/CyaY-like superfamily)
VEDLELVDARDRAAWRRWLERHHRRDFGVWVVLHKKGSTDGTLFYEEAVREALCFGWIDSTGGAIDDRRYRVWMAPRKPRSGWSAVNKRRIDDLIAEGSMSAAGLAVIEAAKADGSWNLHDRSDALELPEDLLAAFARYADSRRHWDAFPTGVRRRSLAWIYTAKRDETRARRVEEIAARAARNERAVP